MDAAAEPGAATVKLASPPCGSVAGIATVTWYSPTNPGDNPEKTTVAGVPPRVTWGVTAVEIAGVAGAAAPKLKSVFTAPRPAM